MMTEAKHRAAIKKFVADWKNKGYEKGDSPKFWMALLRDVLAVENPEQIIDFEKPVKIGKNTKYIDAYIEQTKVLIEQKSFDNNLTETFDQAKDYANQLPHWEHPRWIVLCNFKKFLIYDMNFPNNDPEEVLLKDLEKEYFRLSFLVERNNSNIKKQKEVSLKAGEIVGKLYDALLDQYKNKTNPHSLKSLNILCVRIVFCLYAEDAGVFEKNQFHNYLNDFKAEHLRGALLNLFKVLNTPLDRRDPYLEPKLKEFQYVNGGLFTDERIEVPNFTEKIKEILLTNASQDFNWSEISPTIFGALFESTINPETRRSVGVHYTSIENIHKIIDPLFMDILNAEFEKIYQLPKGSSRTKKLIKFQEKISQLRFLDPACGSGNFLTETYISLRRLENEILRELYVQGFLGDVVSPIKVSIQQFYGIEINDFAVAVAKTALWISESQMLKETEDIVHINLDFLPLKTYSNIVEANALRIDWETVISKQDLDYIIGNPPYGGYVYTTKEQKEDLALVYLDEKGKPYKNSKKNDYVSCWCFKAAQFMQGTKVKAAFVSTNSITQGEQVVSVWRPIYNRFKIHIDFAYRTFYWDSKSGSNAHVCCVIIGFSCDQNKDKKRLFSETEVQLVDNINFYLNDAPNVFVEKREKPLCLGLLEMRKGSEPNDGGNLIIENNEYENFIRKEPQAKKYIKQLVGAEEFLNNKKRYCLWLLNASPFELKSCPLIIERVQKVRELRLSKNIRRLADQPTRFAGIRQPEVDYLLIPRVSSEARKYLPMGFVSKDIISTDANLLLPGATIYHFGILTSSVHMAWMRTICGRLKSDYRYSKGLVYNNFPWCNPTEDQKTQIEKTAQEILDVRALYPDSSLAYLYDETTMPPALRKAHLHNDQAVIQAYGFRKDISESEIVAELMKMYQKLAALDGNH